jgi:hypothetical protein
MRWLYLWIVAAGLLAAGCGQGAVVFAPTPLPPELAPALYTHPSGAFTVELPGDWAAHTHESPRLAAAHFTPPGMDEPALVMAVIQLDAAGAEADLLALVNEYQTRIRPDLARYSEQERQALDDGSWRLIGLRATLGGLPQQVNTFVERAGAFVGLVEVLIPLRSEQRTQVESVINTFAINPEAELQAAALSTLAGAFRRELEIVNISRWQTPEGVFFVTGEIVNHGEEIVAEVPVRIELQTEDGAGLAEALDTVMGYGLPPGEFAPFSLRFGHQPEEAARYTLTLGGEHAVLPPDALRGAETLTWTDDSTLTDEGHLLITGTLTNTGSRAVRDPLATVTVFDAGQNVIAAGFAPVIEGSLLPDDSVDFHLRVPEMGGEPANYIVNIQALPDD